MCAKRFTIPELESDNRKKKRLAAEITRAAECRFRVQFLPNGNFSAEDVLPVAMRESRGHVFKATFIPPKGTHDEFSLDAWFDDRDEPIAESVADHLRDLAASFMRLAASIEALGLKGGGA